MALASQRRLDGVVGDCMMGYQEVNRELVYFNCFNKNSSKQANKKQLWWFAALTHYLRPVGLPCGVDSVPWGSWLQWLQRQQLGSSGQSKVSQPPRVAGCRRVGTTPWRRISHWNLWPELKSSEAPGEIAVPERKTPSELESKAKTLSLGSQAHLPWSSMIKHDNLDQAWSSIFFLL